MKNFVSVRISNKFEHKGEINHDFHNSHNRKINDKPNYIINSNSVIPFHRDTNKKFNTESIEDNHKYSLGKAKDDYKENHPRSMKSNTNIEYKGIITFGNEDKTLSRAEMDALDQDVLDTNALHFLQQFVKDNGIDENSIYLVKHNDESQIHYHFSFIAYDHNSHEVMRSRMNPKFMSGLQDLAGSHFEESGFHRGIKKSERLEQTLYEKDISLEGYKTLPIDDKYKILEEANVKNKAPRQQHSELKNDLYKLQKSIDKSLSLFDKVEQMSPKELKEVQEGMDSEDKLVKRFFTYAVRLHSKKADKEKAVKNLDATINKLGHQKDDIEAEFHRYYQQRYQEIEPEVFDNQGINQEQLNIDKTRLFNKVIVDKSALDKLTEYAQKMQEGYEHYVDKYNSIAELVEPLKEYIPDFKDLVNLKDEVNNLRFKLSSLKMDIGGYEERVDRVTDKLSGIHEKSLELQKNPSNAKLSNEIKSDARGVQVDVIRIQDTIEDDTEIRLR